MQYLLKFAETNMRELKYDETYMIPDGAIDEKYNLHTHTYIYICTQSYQLVEQSVGYSVSWHVLSRLDTVRGAPSLV